MQDAQRQRLTGRNARVEAGSAWGGGCLAAFGLPFLGVGVLVFVFMTGGADAARKGVPDWVPGAAGTSFAAAGAFLVLTGLRAVAASRRRAALRRERPQEPWIADYRWSGDGVWDDPPSILGQMVTTVFLTVFLTPFNFFVWFTGDGAVVPRVIVSFFDLIVLGVVGSLVYSILQRLKYGRSFLAFDAFPLLTGSTSSMRLRLPRALAGADRLKVVLRAIEVVTETRRTAKGSRTETFLDQVWAEDRVLDQPGLLGGGDVTLVFDLPDRAPGTNLDGSPSLYWEMEVSAETPGIDYATAFVVPVYAPPAA